MTFLMIRRGLHIRAGIGSVTLDTDAPTDKDDTVSTAQGKLGVTYDAVEKLTFSERLLDNVMVNQI